MFNNQWAKSLTQKFSQVQASDITDTELKSKFLKLKAAKQAGFTLLELLVVVAILAAIAGTATIALQDTDARASAAVHVAMMDELNKGVRTFRVLNSNQLPNNFDSLMVTNQAGIPLSGVAATLLPHADGEILAIGDVAAGTLVAGAAGHMDEIGMTSLRYIISDLDVYDDAALTAVMSPEDVAAGGCNPAGGVLQDSVQQRSNAMVAGNIFNGMSGNGCGRSVTLDDTSVVAYWSGTIERVLGPGEYGNAAFNGTAMVGQTANSVAPVLMAVGFGPSSNLFNANDLGGMTSVPAYRHVPGSQYNRFIGLFHVANSAYDGTDYTYTAKDQISYSAVVDGAGDTKDEELGEWDGTRNTI
jgi:prepilin-type N-terminal cleavage/methylation domain-containing protein